MAGIDVLLVSAVCVGQVDLVVLMIADPLAIRGGIESVGEAVRSTGNIRLVGSIEFHQVGLRGATDQRCHEQLRAIG